MAIKVLFGCPTYGPIHRKVYESHLCAIAKAANTGIETKFVVVSGKMGLASAENHIARAALAVKPDFIFWTEMDMVLPSDAIVNLVKHAEEYKLDAVSGVYFLRGTGEPCLYISMPENWTGSKYGHGRYSTFPENSLFRVGCAGMGVMLTRLSVFEKLSEPFFDDKENGYGTDIYFSTKMREAGIQLWADSSVLCGQIDEDEPQRWDHETYKEWLVNGGGKGGFLGGSDADAIRLG